MNNAAMTTTIIELITAVTSIVFMRLTSWASSSGEVGCGLTPKCSVLAISRAFGLSLKGEPNRALERVVSGFAVN